MAKEAIISAGHAAKIAARRQRKSDAYAQLETAVGAANKTHEALALMTTGELRTMIGEKANGLSGTFVGNLQQRLVKKMQQAELQSAADWVKSLILVQYPNADVTIKRGRVVQVWLDGKPEEPEL